MPYSNAFTTGSHWLFDYRGKKWPIIVPAKDMIPPEVKRKDPGGYSIPVLRYGKYDFFWAQPNDLLEYVPYSRPRAREGNHNTPESQQTEFDRAHEEGLGMENLDYFRSALYAKALASGKIRQDSVEPVRKRSHEEAITNGLETNPVVVLGDSEDLSSQEGEDRIFRSPFAKKVRFEDYEVDDSEPEEVSPKSETTTQSIEDKLPPPKKIKLNLSQGEHKLVINTERIPLRRRDPVWLGFVNVLPDERRDSKGIIDLSNRKVGDEADSSKDWRFKKPPLPAKTPKIKEPLPIPRSSGTAAKSVESDSDDSEEEEDENTQREPIDLQKIARDHLPEDPDMALMLIGDTPGVFQVPFNKIKSNRYLDECAAPIDVVLDNAVMRRVWVVSRAAWDELNPSAFTHIAAYLRRGDFEPKIVPNAAGEYILEDVYEEEERFSEMENLPRIFVLARDLQIFDIFTNLSTRFNLLKPWPPTLLLFMARAVLREDFTGHDGDEAMRDLIKDHIARDFWGINQSDNTKNLEGVMELDRQWSSEMLKDLADIYAGAEEEPVLNILNLEARYCLYMRQKVRQRQQELQRLYPNGDSVPSIFKGANEPPKTMDDAKSRAPTKHRRVSLLRNSKNAWDPT
ncbi:hypothetical protein NA57DRAFT_77874 [Rhizodiscina lignyota]|uniref:Uncharacterized protein n=1 Tax=Rhizodiscina lignyota TaxID=1504668 RepID=A0A9P4IG86_9PEZI|nr:hypothetical protein NA57DRAFT_77874 [Rhizodiscina lignyota]